MKAIFYKNYLGEWTRSLLPPTLANLAFVQKHSAENGRAMIQIVSRAPDCRAKDKKERKKK